MNSADANRKRRSKKDLEEEQGGHMKRTNTIDAEASECVQKKKKKRHSAPPTTAAPSPTEGPFLHHCGTVADDDDALKRLAPLPPPPSEIPIPPPHPTIAWHFEEASRVYVGDFTSVDIIPREQKWFIGSLMERDDITVILEGLYDQSIDIPSFLDTLGRSFSDAPFAKFRQFSRQPSHVTGRIEYEEMDGFLAMDVSTEYLDYLARHVYGASDFETCTFDLQNLIETNAGVVSDARCPTNVAADANTAMKSGAPSTEDTTHDKCIEMSDVEMAAHFPRFDRQYKNSFKMKEILPGGAWCWMSHVCDFVGYWPFLLLQYVVSPIVIVASGTIATIFGAESLYFSR